MCLEMFTIMLIEHFLKTQQEELQWEGLAPVRLKVKAK